MKLQIRFLFRILFFEKQRMKKRQACKKQASGTYSILWQHITAGLRTGLSHKICQALLHISIKSPYMGH